MHAIVHSRARSAAIVAALVMVFLVPVPAPLAAAGPKPSTPPPGLAVFMEALGAVESSGRYDARNAVSGAYGKYQIMPSNWPAWAARYLGDGKAKPTPRNQDRVAGGRLSDLYRAYGAWDRTAYWWLTGKRGPRDTWSAYARRYVSKVMTGYRTRLATPAAGSRRVLDERSQAIGWRGSWSVARHGAYSGGTARYATARGAAAVVRFTGRSVRIVGPTGPTRGRVQVLVDGRLARTVDLRASRFHPVATIFTRTWPRRGTHRVELRVVGTAGRPHVALDRIVIGG